MSTLLSIVVLAGLDGAVRSSHVELTLVAPTNDAFAKLLQDTVDFLTSDDGKEIIKEDIFF